MNSNTNTAFFYVFIIICFSCSAVLFRKFLLGYGSPIVFNNWTNPLSLLIDPNKASVTDRVVLLLYVIGSFLIGIFAIIFFPIWPFYGSLNPL